jgi:EAL domain-containing protein (putative c-di-GMP-specific phosphodiesterase class I)/DNA-binding response OmpR family regulator
MNPLSVEASRIFIVDDQEANLRLLERILVRAGFSAVTAFGDGTALLAAMETTEPDLVLLDLHMPGRDGFSVLEEIRSRTGVDGYLPVLVLTADTQRAARSRALASGAQDFLTKPLDTEEVALRVRNLLVTRSLQQALLRRNIGLADEVADRTRSLRETEAEWTAVTSSLSRLHSLDTPESTAAAICGELGRLHDLAAVSVIAFGPAGSVTALGVHSTIGSSFEEERAIPPVAAARIRDCIGSGPWFGSWTAFSDGLAMPSPFTRPPSAVALLPLRVAGDVTLGALAVLATGSDEAARVGHNLAALEAFGTHAAALLGPGLLERQRAGEVRDQIRLVVAGRAHVPVFQPVVRLDSTTVVGYEGLTRFADGTRPDRLFESATAVGLGLELEAACVQSSLEAAAALPPTAWLSLNVSPEFVLAGNPLARLVGAAGRPIVLEITEHVPIDDYAALRDAISALGPAVRFAIDDAGAGFSSFRHIVELRPDFVKLDIGLIRSIERDTARQAFVAGLVYFAQKTGCGLIAEGIETEGQRAMLAGLAVDFGQGFLLGRPAPAPSAQGAEGDYRSPAA